jgi:uncharacterized protein
VFFITQTPKDIPADVLGQLGNRIQHALRAFTPDDEKALRATVKTYPKSNFYDIQALLTSMGIGEAAVTILSESGVPTPVVHTRLLAPRSRMAPTDDVEKAAKASLLYTKYGTRIDNQSARELLAARMAPPAVPAGEPQAPAAPTPPKPTPRQKQAAAAAGGGIAAVGKFLKSRQGQAIEKQIVRGIFGMLKKR